MDSINFIKGYDKVNNTHENRPLPPPPQKAAAKKPVVTTITIAVSILFFIIIIGSMIVALIHESKPEPIHESGNSPSLSLNSAESIRTVCSVTRYPDSCFSSISSLNVSTKPDPESILKLSLHVSIKELSNISFFIKTLNNSRSEAALGDCLSQIEDALGRLKDSVSEMEVVKSDSEEKMLTERKVGDIQTWVSAAMTDQDGCVDGLEEMRSTVIDEVKGKMQKSKEYMSNSLAIVAKIQTLLDEFNLTMH